MRILHYVGRLIIADGGLVRAAIDTCHKLAEHGVDITLLTKEAADVPPEWQSNPTAVEVPVPAGGLGRFNAEQMARVRALIDDADVVHLHSPWEPANVQLAAYCRKIGKPYVVTVHGMLDDWSMSQRTLKKKLYLKFVAKAMHRDAYAVHCTAQAERDQVITRIPRDNIRIIPYVFDTGPYLNLPGPEKAREQILGGRTEPLLLFLSRIHVKKGLEVFLKAAAIVRKKRPLLAAIAGTGEPDYTAGLERLARELGIEKDVMFLGLVVGEMKTSLYQAADVYALPTYQENFGIVLPESLACRTPVVTTRATDIWPELEGSGGAIIEQADPEKFAAAIESLLDDDQKRADMGEKGRAWVLDYLDPDSTTRRFIELYKSAIDAKS